MKRLLLVAALLLGLLCGCSPRGAHMPTHRKKRHCDCPTFAQVQEIPEISQDQ